MTNYRKGIKEEIYKICTYHGDEGTSGYCLSNEQFDELFALFEKKLTQARNEERERAIQEIEQAKHRC